MNFKETHAEDPVKLAELMAEVGKEQAKGQVLKTPIDLARRVFKARGTDEAVVQNVLDTLKHMNTAAHITARDRVIESLGKDKPKTFEEMRKMPASKVVVPFDGGVFETSVKPASSHTGPARGDGEDPKPVNKIGVDSMKLSLKRCDPDEEIIAETKKAIGNATSHLDEVAQLLAE